jgi:hypothetical protein
VLFRGVIHQFLKQKQYFGNLQGLYFFLINSENRSSYSVHSLAGLHNGRSRTPRRRQNLALRSWVGWDGGVEYFLFGERSISYLEVA